jgi:hypothetical protein
VVALPPPRPHGGRTAPDHDRGRVPRQRAAAVRLPQPRGEGSLRDTSRTGWFTTAAAGTGGLGSRSRRLATFRVDRISLRGAGGPAVRPRPPPDGDVVAHVSRGWTRRPGLPRQRPRARARRRARPPPARVGRRRGDRRTHVRRPRGLRLAGDAGHLPGDAGRRLRGRGSAPSCAQSSACPGASGICAQRESPSRGPREAEAGTDSAPRVFRAGTPQRVPLPPCDGLRRAKASPPPTSFSRDPQRVPIPPRRGG